MNDLISRQAAIVAVEEYADRLQMVNWKENPNVPYKVHALNWCINTIRDLPSTQQWILCSERLPAEGEPVLLCDSAGNMTLGRLVRTDEGYKWDNHTWYTDIEDWDAWIPLPEPYKEEENETN